MINIEQEAQKYLTAAIRSRSFHLADSQERRMYIRARLRFCFLCDGSGVASLSRAMSKLMEPQSNGRLAKVEQQTITSSGSRNPGS